MSRVLSVVSSSDRRGAEVFASQLAAELQTNHALTVTVAALAESQSTATLPVVVLGRSRSDPRTLSALVHAARSTDVMISNGGTTLLPVAAAAILTRTPFIYRNIGDPGIWGRVRLAGVRIGLPLRRAARVVALYEAAAGELRARYGIDGWRVTVVPNGVPVEDFPFADEDLRTLAREALDLAPDRIWMAVVGSLSDEKSPLTAFRILEQDERLGLVIAGDGPLASACRREAAAFAPDRVRFLGQVPSSREVLHAVDVLLVPSLTEGIPGVVIEAGLSGIPVVATEVGGVAEVVIDGVTGVVSDSRDPEQLAGHVRWATQHRSRLGVEARRHCLEHFSMTAVAAAWSGVISELVNPDGE